MSYNQVKQVYIVVLETTAYKIFFNFPHSIITPWKRHNFFLISVLFSGFNEPVYSNMDDFIHKQMYIYKHTTFSSQGKNESLYGRVFHGYIYIIFLLRDRRVDEPFRSVQQYFSILLPINQDLVIFFIFFNKPISMIFF